MCKRNFECVNYLKYSKQPEFAKLDSGVERCRRKGNLPDTFYKIIVSYVPYNLSTKTKDILS